jgi:hypothetical protein
VTGDLVPDRSVSELTRQFFKEYPDYAFCQTLAANVHNQVVSYPNALALLGKKALSAEENRQAIEEQINSRTIVVDGWPRRIAEFSLRAAMRLDDQPLGDLLRFYFKHPYANGRTWRTRLLPRWVRAFYLNVLVGHAFRRGVSLDYRSYFQMLKLL